MIGFEMLLIVDIGLGSRRRQIGIFRKGHWQWEALQFQKTNERATSDLGYDNRGCVRRNIYMQLSSGSVSRRFVLQPHVCSTLHLFVLQPHV